MSLRYVLIGKAIDRLAAADEALREHGATQHTLQAYQLAARALAWVGCTNTARFASKRAERVLELLETCELDVVESPWASICEGLHPWVLVEAATGALVEHTSMQRRPAYTRPARKPTPAQLRSRNTPTVQL